ncbi:hypothetical protein JCM5353_003422 [Sporobolomyces roseus]
MGVNLSSLPSQYSDQDAKEASLALAADYTGVALLSVAVWDTLLCLRRARSTALKWFYLLTRYLGLATGALLVATNTSRVLSESKTCKHLARAVLALATLASTFGLLIRSYRVLAIYSFNRSILILLSFFVLLATVLQFYIVSKWQGAEVPDGIMGCYPTPNPLRSQLLTTSIPGSTQPSSGAEQRTTTSYICGEFGTLDESNLPGPRNVPPLASVEVVQRIEESISEAQDPPSPVSTRNSSV